ncbi:sensor histidine kinase [Pseudobacter ginsenosidimutans]|uniref:Histidine kinase n=1 Tax=Pseudobacter ginsenosidimutans TaxID=661488 RepID=A0A4Q7N5E4_9BACT|nr:sensor histidine kinase [Pseudobacter ginsenosidimutans]RZS76249.1 histidine kinase [Pseudobacter ginsenosidimutans]
MIRNQSVNIIFRKPDSFLFAGLYSWMAVFHILAPSSGGRHWQLFFETMAVLLVSMLPVLFFTWQREKWKNGWSRKKYNIAWWCCFAGYIPLLLLVTGANEELPNSWRQLVFMASIFTWLLELLLVLNSWYRQRAGQWQWFRAISLEKAVLISIGIIALLLSLMATSSIGNPAYDSNGQLLIGFEFKPGRIIGEFGSFLAFLLQFLFMYCCGYGYFILNSKLLVPMVLRLHGALIYTLTALATVSLSYPLIGFLLNRLPFNDKLGSIFPANPFQLENAFGAILILLLSLPVILALQWSRQNNRIMALEKEKAETELDLLKQQLNPHFFFNTLNNLYALSLAQSKQTPESILQLSELMRYVIYKAKDNNVNIRDEVKYIEDYIRLQQIRLKRHPNIQFSKEVVPDTPPVAPLLLIVLVENAFKHGIEPAESNSFLELQLVTTQNSLHFTCINSFEESLEGSGIGLENLRRRLVLLYPGKHLLKTGKENHIFKAELELDLS